MDEKQYIFFKVVRDILVQLLSAIEDYLSIAYDESKLYNRRKKIGDG